MNKIITFFLALIGVSIIIVSLWAAGEIWTGRFFLYHQPLFLIQNLIVWVMVLFVIYFILIWSNVTFEIVWRQGLIQILFFSFMSFGLSGGLVYLINAGLITQSVEREAKILSKAYGTNPHRNKNSDPACAIEVPSFESHSWTVTASVSDCGLWSQITPGRTKAWVFSEKSLFGVEFTTFLQLDTD